ncbi:uncharacterized protein B0J16DRAFT_326559 [Fusarium flagelliforme]|uniref:Uncharacterized protein n=1 Tax=Fusarium flagelliforme TaxID=2675880 RepID=A0A395MHJ6_9HYPO|nr:uncharacterized protein B0J16DRAFT_326559 [Fusarium flagelliforme]KAH7196745.1 hypothetical protein B0J16DRAFT_326559 [Fusarium flagelliforme]RFN47398.1 hypothetical protein FIE12Z_8400 [Fusarium flagelliforme]
MEPPTKKRRHGSSSHKDAQDEEDDDELASHPQELKIRRDPDIQFALKRANANQKLHATMAHIIEKYSRDFEGIGDEIDMATGEIVVNNGHLHNMRDEGDVEGLWVEGDSNIDEDEGIRLEDLTDEYSDNEEPVTEIRDSQTENESSQEPRTKEKDNKANQPGGNEGTDETLRNASNIANSQDEPPQGKGTASPLDLPYDDPRSSPSPFGPGPSFSYGMPPPGFGPWGMMPGFPMQAWGRDDIPPYFNMPPSMPGPWYNGGKYEFPSNNGQSSIWGRNWARKTKRVGSMKGSFKKASERQSSGIPVEGGTEVVDDGHETGSRSTGEKTPRQEPPLSDRTIDASDEEDDFLCSGATESVPVVRSSPAPSNQKGPARRRSVQRLSQMPLEETDANAARVSPPSDEKDDSGRRRSGRARRQTEYMGKISWEDAREWKKSGNIVSVKIHRVDPSIREEYQSIDPSSEDSEGEEPSSSEQTQSNLPSTETRGTEPAASKMVIPDSQDMATPFNSSAPQASQSKEKTREPSPFISNTISTMELSDDEAPLVLSRIRLPKQQTIAPKVSSPASDVPPRHRDRTAEPITAIDTALKAGRESAHDARNSADVVEDAVQPLKRKPRRPKGSVNTTKITPPYASVAVPVKEVEPSSPAPTTVPTTGDLSHPPKRKRGRPRKSEVVTPIARSEAKDHIHELIHVDDDVSKDSQQEAAGEIPENKDSQVSHRLSHEIRWLLKTKPKNSVSDRIQGPSFEEHVQPRRSRESLEQSEDNMAESEDAVPEAMEAIEDMEDGTKEQQEPERPQSSIQEDDTIMDDAPAYRESSPESAHSNQTLPSSPVSLALDNRVADDNGSTDGNSHTVHLDIDDEDTRDQEPLPTLPEEAPVQEASTPRKPKDIRNPLLEPPSSSQKPHTPRHRSIRTKRAPSSRRSLLSFVSDSDSDPEGSRDELTRRIKSHSKSTSARPSSKKVWRSTTLTREIHRTPSKRRVHDMSSPVGTVKTPGGTVRICGVDGYHCGRDYCFTCI